MCLLTLSFFLLICYCWWIICFLGQLSSLRMRVPLPFHFGYCWYSYWNLPSKFRFGQMTEMFPKEKMPITASILLGNGSSSFWRTRLCSCAKLIELQKYGKGLLYKIFVVKRNKIMVNALNLMILYTWVGFLRSYGGGGDLWMPYNRVNGCQYPEQ